jgi:hypothetical protein
MDKSMKSYRVTVRRVRRTEVVYAADLHGIEAESEAEARLKAEAVLPRLPGVKNERWSKGDPETTLGPPEIIEVEDEMELLGWLGQVQKAVTAPNEAST